GRPWDGLERTVRGAAAPSGVSDRSIVAWEAVVRHPRPADTACPAEHFGKRRWRCGAPRGSLLRQRGFGSGEKRGRADAPVGGTAAERNGRLVQERGSRHGTQVAVDVRGQRRGKRVQVAR